jgi:hypothetical protein
MLKITLVQKGEKNYNEDPQIYNDIATTKEDEVAKEIHKW